MYYQQYTAYITVCFSFFLPDNIAIISEKYTPVRVYISMFDPKKELSEPAAVRSGVSLYVTGTRSPVVDAIFHFVCIQPPCTESPFCCLPILVFFGNGHQ